MAKLGRGKAHREGMTLLKLMGRFPDDQMAMIGKAMLGKSLKNRNLIA